MYNGEMEKKVAKPVTCPNYAVSNTLLLRQWDSSTVELIDVDMDDKIAEGGVVHSLWNWMFVWSQGVPLNDPSTISTPPFSVLPNQRAPERGQDEGTVGGFSRFLRKKQDFKCSSTFTNLLSCCKLEGVCPLGVHPGPLNLWKKKT